MHRDVMDALAHLVIAVDSRSDIRDSSNIRVQPIRHNRAFAACAPPVMSVSMNEEVGASVSGPGTLTKYVCE